MQGSQEARYGLPGAARGKRRARAPPAPQPPGGSPRRPWHSRGDPVLSRSWCLPACPPGGAEQEPECLAGLGDPSTEGSLGRVELHPGAHRRVALWVPRRRGICWYLPLPCHPALPCAGPGVWVCARLPPCPGLALPCLTSPPCLPAHQGSAARRRRRLPGAPRSGAASGCGRAWWVCPLPPASGCSPKWASPSG